MWKTLPAVDFNGTEGFTYTLSDDEGETDTTTVAITVTGVNDVPMAVNGAFTINENTTLNGNVLVDNGKFWEKRGTANKRNLNSEERRKKE